MLPMTSKSLQCFRRCPGHLKIHVQEIRVEGHHSQRELSWGCPKQLERRRVALEPGFPLVPRKIDPVPGSLRAGRHWNAISGQNHNLPYPQEMKGRECLCTRAHHQSAVAKALENLATRELGLEPHRQSRLWSPRSAKSWAGKGLCSRLRGSTVQPNQV